jgi:hypothetical protein
MPAPFRRADRHRPSPAERHQRRIDARRSLERSRRQPDLAHDQLRAYWHFR